MSELLNQRSLHRARQLIKFRVGLIVVSLTFFSLGTAAILLPASQAASEALSKLFKTARPTARFVLWAGVGLWLYYVPRLFITSLRSAKGLDTVFPVVGQAYERLRWTWRLFWRFGSATGSAHKWQRLFWLVAVILLCSVLYVAKWDLRYLPLVFAEQPVEWAVYWMAAAIVAGALVPVLEYLRNESAQEAHERLVIAATPQYASDENRVDNGVLYQLYRSKNVPETRARFNLVNVPIYFVVPPSPVGYKVEGLGDHSRAFASSDDVLSRAAARWGLDWSGFARWRQRQEQERYLWGYVREDGFGVTKLYIRA